MYFQAWASDSINEVHPEKLTGFLPTHSSKKPFTDDVKPSLSTRSEEQMDEFSSFLRLKESELEEAIISVADLKKQFVRDSNKKKTSLKTPRAKTTNHLPGTRTTPGNRSRPCSPMSANIAALSKRFHTYTVPLALPGQDANNTGMCMQLYECICICIYIYTYIYIHIYMCVCMSVCVSVYVCVCE